MRRILFITIMVLYVYNPSIGQGISNGNLKRTKIVKATVKLSDPFSEEEEESGNNFFDTINSMNNTLNNFINEGNEDLVLYEEYYEKEDDSGNYVKQGEYKRYFTDAHKTGRYSNDGNEVIIHRNSNLVETQGYYVGDKKHGQWISRNKEGKIICLKNYKDDILDGPFREFKNKGNYTDGKKNGFWEYEIFEDGKYALEGEGSYVMGKKSGKWLIRYSNKEIKLNELYSYGIINRNGKKYYVVQLENDLLVENPEMIEKIKKEQEEQEKKKQEMQRVESEYKRLISLFNEKYNTEDGETIKNFIEKIVINKIDHEWGHYEIVNDSTFYKILSKKPVIEKEFFWKYKPETYKNELELIDTARARLMTKFQQLPEFIIYQINVYKNTRHIKNEYESLGNRLENKVEPYLLKNYEELSVENKIRSMLKLFSVYLTYSYLNTSEYNFEKTKQLRKSKNPEEIIKLLDEIRETERIVCPEFRW